MADADLDLRVGRVAHRVQVDAVELEALRVLQEALVGLGGRHACEQMCTVLNKWVRRRLIPSWLRYVVQSEGLGTSMRPVHLAHFREQLVRLALHEREVAQVIDALAVLRHVVIANLRLHHVRTCASQCMRPLTSVLQSRAKSPPISTSPFKSLSKQFYSSFEHKLAA